MSETEQKNNRRTMPYYIFGKQFLPTRLIGIGITRCGGEMDIVNAKLRHKMCRPMSLWSLVCTLGDRIEIKPEIRMNSTVLDDNDDERSMEIKEIKKLDKFKIGDIVRDNLKLKIGLQRINNETGPLMNYGMILTTTRKKWTNIFMRGVYVGRSTENYSMFTELSENMNHTDRIKFTLSGVRRCGFISDNMYIGGMGTNDMDKNKVSAISLFVGTRTRYKNIDITGLAGINTVYRPNWLIKITKRLYANMYGMTENRCGKIMGGIDTSMSLNKDKHYMSVNIKQKMNMVDKNLNIIGGATLKYDIGRGDRDKMIYAGLEYRILPYVKFGLIGRYDETGVEPAFTISLGS